jgi:hypothetical protein
MAALFRFGTEAGRNVAVPRGHKVAERLIESEREAEPVRADFHCAIRRLHLRGASLREIASALGMSHQRVHIVEGAGEVLSLTMRRR